MRYKGSAHIMGVSFYAVSFCLGSGRLRGRTCNLKVVGPFWACRLRCARRQTPRVLDFCGSYCRLAIVWRSKRRPKRFWWVRFDETLKRGPGRYSLWPPY